MSRQEGPTLFLWAGGTEDRTPLILGLLQSGTFLKRWSSFVLTQEAHRSTIDGPREGRDDGSRSRPLVPLGFVPWLGVEGRTVEGHVNDV